MGGLHRCLRRDGCGKTAAGHGRCVRDGIAGRKRRNVRDAGLIEQHGVSAGGNGKSGHGERWSRGHGGRCLQYAVYIILDRAIDIRKRIDRVRTDGVSAEIVGDRDAGERRRAGVHERDGVGHVFPGGIRRSDGGFCDGKSFKKLARNGVRVGRSSVIGKRGKVGKARHGSHSKK